MMREVGSGPNDKLEGSQKNTKESSIHKGRQYSRLDPMTKKFRAIEKNVQKISISLGELTDTTVDFENPLPEKISNVVKSSISKIFKEFDSAEELISRMSTNMGDHPEITERQVAEFLEKCNLLKGEITRLPNQFSPYSAICQDPNETAIQNKNFLERLNRSILSCEELLMHHKLTDYEKKLEKYKSPEKEPLKIQKEHENFKEVELNERSTENIYLDQLKDFCRKDSEIPQLKRIFGEIQKSFNANDFPKATKSLENLYEEMEELTSMLENLSKNTPLLEDSKKAEYKNFLIEIHKELHNVSKSIGFFSRIIENHPFLDMKGLKNLHTKVEVFYQKNMEVSRGIVKALEKLYEKDLKENSQTSNFKNSLKGFLGTW